MVKLVQHFVCMLMVQSDNGYIWDVIHRPNPVHPGPLQ